MQPTTKRQVGLGCLGGVVGAVAGLIVAGASGYALAELVTDSAETQAYLLVLLVPGLAFLGAVTGATTLAAWPTKSRPLAFVGSAGLLALGLLFALGLSWGHRTRPAQVRVRNETSVTFTSVYVGSDFRRNQRIGELAPNETSRRVPVDLDRPSTFNAIDGNSPRGYVRHHLGPSPSVPEGTDFVWVVSEAEPDGLRFSFEVSGD